MTPAATDTTIARQISLRGCRTHNLQGVDIDFPCGELIVITGVSGSGKSSLAFDTLHAEGRRRYLSTISPRLRRLLDRGVRAELDSLEGLPPTFAVGQYRPTPGDRATVAGLCEVHDLLRVLLARAGTLWCPTCQIPVSTIDRTQVIDTLLARFPGSKLLILAPLVHRQAGDHTATLARIVREGFVRARVNGEVIDAAAPPELPRQSRHTIEAVVDRLVLKAGIRERLDDSIDTALQLGGEVCVVSVEQQGKWVDHLVSPGLTCHGCGTAFPTLTPAHFSKNSQAGACEHCSGAGSLAADTPPQDQPAAQSDATRAKCLDCNGSGYGVLARSTKLLADSLPALLQLSPSLVRQKLDSWQRTTGCDEAPEAALATRHLLPEILQRLERLVALGLDYLQLDRTGDTLSAGEVRRCQLVSCLSSEQTGVCYVFDEPSAGLHAADLPSLWQRLEELRTQGNTVIVVEHELSLVARAERVIEVGPGAGALGGTILVAGSPAEVGRLTTSATGRALVEPRTLNNTFQQTGNWLTLTGACARNLQQLTVKLPLRALVGVTGVSGSGKSSLLLETLVPALQRHLRGQSLAGLPCADLEGASGISRVVAVDQQRLGRSQRSTVATVAGIWEEVRRLLVKTRESRLRGLRASHFSWLHPDGRCPQCQGKGVVSLGKELDRTLSITCDRCAGSRFDAPALAVTFKRHNVVELLALTCDEALSLFSELPRLASRLTTLCKVGLGYLRLGQATAELSGGESTRVRIARELIQTSGIEPTLYVLDEPCAGLHDQDIAVLSQSLRQLIAAGHSVMIVEHRLRLLAQCDWLIDLGPGAGPAGGQLVGVGTPAQLAEQGQSPTGRALSLWQTDVLRVP